MHHCFGETPADLLNMFDGGSILVMHILTADGPVRYMLIGGWVICITTLYIFKFKISQSLLGRIL